MNMDTQQKLALYGGEPLRKKPFPSNYLGVTLFGDEELAELRDVIAEKSPFRHYGIGKPCKTASFEAEVRKYFGCRFTLAVSSGTGALLCAITALGIGPGDEVILPAFGWYSDFYAITNSGALPVFADIDETLSLDPADLERKITSKTKAVIVINFQGCPADMDKILKVTKERGIKVIEDCAQAFGGNYKGRKLGTMGDIAIASFQQNKILSCGEGGLVMTDNEEYFARAVRYHDLGFIRPIFEEQLEDKSLAKAEDIFAGMQFRMSELQGAVMLAQFRKLDTMLGICRKNHAMVREYFKNNRNFKIRYTDGDCGITVFLLFGTKEEAVKFGECLKAEGVRIGATSACKNLVPQYPIKSKKLAHASLPPFGKGFDGENYEYDNEKCCPNTDRISERFLGMGIGPQYTDEDVGDLINAIEKVSANLYCTMG
jgi:8-amino-3,8-dideoxy-alpha-D-manno-octulosonate transaminase